MMARDREPTTLEFALLGLLAVEPRSGYDLLHLFETTAMGNYSSSPGAIYPALRRLQDRGLIAGKIDDTRALRPKQVFRTTTDGGRRLKQWLQREITRDDVRRHLDRLLLRFAFHSLLPAKATRKFLGELASSVEEHVAELKEQLRSIPPEAPPHGRMALELGIEHYRASARWARRMLRQFEEKAS